MAVFKMLYTGALCGFLNSLCCVEGATGSLMCKMYVEHIFKQNTVNAIVFELQ